MPVAQTDTITVVEAISLFAAIISIILGVVAIVISVWQGRGSQQNYEKTSKLLSDINTEVDRVQHFVSENFQELLENTFKHQEKLMDIVSPRQSPEERAAKAIKLLDGEDTESLGKKVDALLKLASEERSNLAR